MSMRTSRTSRSSPFGRLQSFARSLGGDIVLVSFSELQSHSLHADVSYAPFNGNLALDWHAKMVYVARERRYRPSVVGGIVHEMGHVFAMKEPWSAAYEFDFAGWENQVSKVCNVRRQWLVNMQDYHIKITDSFDSWKYFTWPERRKWIRAAIERGKGYGNLTKDGLPISVR